MPNNNNTVAYEDVFNWGGRTSTVVFKRPKLVHSSGRLPRGKIKIKTILLHFEPISTISLINLSS